MRHVFSVEERDRVRDRVLEMAHADARVVAAAVVGAMAAGPGDQWSDLDLTFGVADGVPVDEVLADWTRDVAHDFDAVHLFDLPAESTIYRVFLLPGCLQVDLSFTPGSEFGARGPRFKLLFGSAVEKPYVPQPAARDLLGLAVHHAVRARFCIERGRPWQAEYWISGVRHQALTLACLHRGLEAHYGRGFDQLPAEVVASFEGALPRSVEREELVRALAAAVAGLLRESVDVPDVERMEARLHELAGVNDANATGRPTKAPSQIAPGTPPRTAP